MNNRYAKILNKKNPIITGVVHHYWYNNADEKNQYYFIEWIELFFHEDEKIIFKRNEESGLIEIVDDNIQELSNQIFENFKGKISIKSIDCSETEWWKGIVNIPTEDGETCLHLVSINKSLSSAELLIKNGADVNARTTHAEVRLILY